MNYIISTLFTLCGDPFRAIEWEPYWKTAMDEWYKSGIQFKDEFQLIAFVDTETERYEEKYPDMIFIQVDPCPKHISIHDYRWLIYESFIEDNEFDNAFFTDISDVVIKQNPFLQLEDDVLYTGDEETKVWDNDWADNKHLYFINKVYDYKYYYQLNKNNRFLNAGIVGGREKTIKQFISKMADYTKRTCMDKSPQISDMLLFNYVAYKHFPKRQHGQPVNSEFTKFEKDRDDVWFVHK
jgi:hypothetical protein